jgi:hypothetical protein
MWQRAGRDVQEMAATSLRGVARTDDRQPSNSALKQARSKSALASPSMASRMANSGEGFSVIRGFRRRPASSPSSRTDFATQKFMLCTTGGASSQDADGTSTGNSLRNTIGDRRR